MIALAGAANEARAVRRGRNVDWIDEGYRSDINFAVELLAAYSAHEDENASHFNWIAERTNPLVNHPSFRSGAHVLAQALMERGSLTGQEAAAWFARVWNEAVTTAKGK